MTKYAIILIITLAACLISAERKTDAMAAKFQSDWLVLITSATTRQEEINTLCEAHADLLGVVAMQSNLLDMSWSEKVNEICK